MESNLFALLYLHVQLIDDGWNILYHPKLQSVYMIRSYNTSLETSNAIQLVKVPMSEIYKINKNECAMCCNLMRNFVTHLNANQNQFFF